MTYPLTIYYDASCPLCRAELHAIAVHDLSGRLRLVDCSAAGFTDRDCTLAGIDAATMMRRIHARDADGQWLVGMQAFEAVYRAVGIEALARVFGSGFLAPVLNRLYGLVADHRQGLSRLGLNGVFAWCVTLLAKRAAGRSQACAEGACRSPDAGRDLRE